MKAELTRNIIDKHVPKTLFNGEHENFELQHVYAELDKLENDARIGKALLKALHEKKYLEMKYTNDILTNDTIDILLRWAEKEM